VSFTTTFYSPGPCGVKALKVKKVFTVVVSRNKELCKNITNRVYLMGRLASAETQLDAGYDGAH
jgi:hypothetical protein